MTQEKLALGTLKAKSPKDLLAMAEELEIENASTMRKGEMMFQILRERADDGWEISGDGVLEVLAGRVWLPALVQRRTTCRVR